MEFEDRGKLSKQEMQLLMLKCVTMLLPTASSALWGRS